MAESLMIRVDQDGDALAIRAEGELDLASASALEDALLHALDGGAASIILDLTAVSFIDPAGLRLLLWADAQSRRDGGRLRIDCGAGAVRRMVELSGVGDSLPAVGKPA
jgi:anti-anti-sigma factor